MAVSKSRSVIFHEAIANCETKLAIEIRKLVPMYTRPGFIQFAFASAPISMSQHHTFKIALI